MAKQCGLSGRQCVRAYREFKDLRGKSVSAYLKTIITVVKMIPVSTAECE
jgi:hypothetical protein